MKLGWFKVSVAFGLLSAFSSPLCALDFDREISKQNAKGEQSSLHLKAKALGQLALKTKDKKADGQDFSVQLTTIKR